MITIFPEGYFQDLFHTEDRKSNPSRHYLTKDSYLRVEMDDMCLECARRHDWNKYLYYDARTDRYYKKEMTAK